MKAEDLQEAGKNLKKLLESEGSCTVVCGQDLAKSQAMEKVIALPL
jgi:hypothetical protein